MANDAGGGTSGAKKKIPDDPYFDSSSPAGSNFKKTTSSVKSNGFQNKQLDDPYFSNTSPAGSTMSSDKSTWRNTNSGWNVPPSGGTAAQGGGSTATRRSPSDDPYYDDRSPAGSTFESQRDRGSTTRSKRGDNAPPAPQYSPDYEGYRSINSTVRDSSSGMDVRWTSPLYASAADGAAISSDVWAATKNAWMKDKDWASQYVDWIDEQPTAGEQGPVYNWLLENSTAAANYRVGSAERWGENSDVAQIQNQIDIVDAELNRLRNEPSYWDTVQFGQRSTFTDAMSQSEAMQRNVGALGALDEMGAVDYTNRNPETLTSFDPGATAEQNMAALGLLQTGSHLPPVDESAPFAVSREERISSLEAERAKLQSALVLATAARPLVEFGELTLALQKGAVNDLLTKPMTAASGKQTDAEISDYLKGYGIDPTPENIESFRNSTISLAEAANIFGATVNSYNPGSNAFVSLPWGRDKNFIEQVNERTGELIDIKLQVDQLPPDEKFLARATIGGLAFTESSRWEKPINEILNYEELTQAQYANIRNFSTVLNDPYATPEQKNIAALQLAQSGRELNRLENKSVTADVQANMTVSSELVWSLFVPDVTDLIANPLVSLVGAGFKKALRTGIPEVTDDVVEAVLKEAVGPRADELASKIAEEAAKDGTNMATVKGSTSWLKGLLQRTPSTEVELIRQTFWDTTGIILNSARTTAEAKALLKGMFDGTLLKVNPNVGRNTLVDPLFASNLPLYKQFEKVILNAESLADNVPFNATVIQGEIDNILDRNVKQLFGLSAQGVPAGSLKVKEVKVGKKWALEYYDGSGKLLYTSDPSYKNKALALAAKTSHQNTIDEFAKNSGAWIHYVNGDFMRHLLSSTYLGTPRNVIRNAMNANATMYFEDGVVLANKATIERRLRSHYNGSLPFEVDQSLTGGAINPEISESSFYDFGGRWKPRNAGGKVPNPLAGTDIKMREIAYGGSAEIPVGPGKSIGIAEGVNRAKAFYHKWEETVYRGAKRISNTLSSSLKEMGLDPDTASPIVHEFRDALEEGGRNSIIQRLRKVVTQDVLPVNLREIGIEPNMLHGNAGRQLVELIQNTDIADPAARRAAINKWLDDYGASLGDELVSSKPQPGSFVNTKARQAQHGAWVADTLEDAYIKSGVDKKTARTQARQMAAAVIKTEQSAWETVRAVAASLENADSVAVNVAFWRKMESELEKLYVELDELRSTYHQIKAAAGKSATETTEAWDRYAKRQVDMWTNYRENIKTYADDITAATLQLEPRQVLREALLARGVDQNTIDSLTRIDVGDKVVLSGTPLPAGQQAAQAAPQAMPTYTVKQVIDNNDMQMYVVTDASGLERTIKASDVATNVTKEELADSISQLAVAEGEVIEGLDSADSLIAQLQRENEEYISGTRTRYDAFDPAENSVIRAKGATGADDDAWWKTYINEGRNYIKHAKDEAVLAYSRYPAQEFSDALVAAENDVLDVGRVVKRQHDIVQQQLLDGKITRAQYDARSAELWGSYWEYGHQRWRYATIQGLRDADGVTKTQILRSQSGKYFVPPYLETDDIRRMASLTGHTIEKGDKRLLNSINKHLKLQAKSLDDLTTAERQAAFKYYLDAAEEEGKDVAAEWYKYRTPDLSDFTDFTDADNFFDAMFRTEALLKSTGGAQAPSVDDYVRTSLRHGYEAAKKVDDNADLLAAGRTNTMTPKQQQEIITIATRLLKEYDDVLYDAERAGREYMNRIMLNYRNRRGFDEVLKVAFPFHYFWSRSLVEWSKRIMRKPSVAYDLWLIDRAVQLDSQQYDGPTRTDNSVPNVLKTLATNLGAPNMVTNLLPDRLYNPAAYAIPYNPLNDFVDPSRANNDYEVAWRYGQRLLPSTHPYISYLADAAFDQYAPIQNDWKRTDQYELGDFLPPYRIAGYGAMAATGDVRMALGGNWLTNSLKEGDSAPGYGPNFLNAGDVYVVGLVGRALRNSIVAGDIEGNDADLAMAWLSTMQANAPIPPELLSRQKDLAPIIEQAASDAGYGKFATQVTSLIFGLSGQMQPMEEAQIRELNKIRGELGYSYDNPWGSQMAQEAYDKIATTDAGVTLGEARQGNDYWKLYTPPEMVPQQPESDTPPMTVQTLSALRQVKWDETSKIYESMNNAMVDFIADNRDTMSRKELLDGLDEIEKPYRLQLKEVDEAYPSVPLGRTRGKAYTYGANPFETAYKELFNILAYEPPGKPIYPAGQEDNKKVMYDYYVAKGEWDMKRDNVVERVTAQLVLQDGPTPSDADNVMARQLLGRTVPELMEMYEFRNTPAEVIDLMMQERVYNENKYPESIQAQTARIVDQFGEDGAMLLMKYRDLPSPTDEERAKGVYFTEEQDAFRDKNPGIDEIRYFANYPDDYLKAIDMFGEDIFELSGTFPGGGTKQEKKRWYNSHRQSEIDRVFGFWAFKDDVAAKNAYLYTPEREANLEALAQDWMNQPRPGEPIGGVSRPEYEAITANTPDLTGLPPQDRLRETAFQQPSRDTRVGQGAHTTGPQATIADPQKFADYNDYLATVYPPLASQMPQGLPRGLPGVTTSGPSTVTQLPQIREALRTGTLNMALNGVKDAVASGRNSSFQRTGGGGGYSGYRYRGRYYRSRRSRRSGYRRRGGYRSYSRGYRSSGYRSRYGGGYGGGGGSTVDEGQELFLNTNNPPRIYAREFASWLMPSSSSRDVWRPTGASTGMRQPQQPSIRPWRRINVRA